MILAVILAPVRVYREALARALDEHGDVKAVAAVESVAEALSHMAQLGPDVVLLDASMSNAPVVAGEIARVKGAARIVAIASPDEDRLVIACAEAGVIGFTSCDAGLDEIVAAAEAAARGEPACPPRIAASLLRRVVAAGTERELAIRQLSGVALTARERQIVALIDEGLSNKDIAERLCIEVSTVKNHVHNVLDKLGARRRSEAAARVRMVSVAAPVE